MQTDASGLLVSRRLQRDDAILAGQKILAQRKAISERFPEKYREIGAEELNLLREITAKLEAAIALGNRDLSKLEVSEEVLRLLGSLGKARSLKLVNYDLDNRVNAITTIVSGNVRARGEDDPRGLAARLLEKILLSEGLGFLKFESPHQWLQTFRRLKKIALDEGEVADEPEEAEEPGAAEEPEAAEEPGQDEEDEKARKAREAREALKAAKLLGVDDLIKEVRILNRHFGMMQGLTEPTGDNIPDPVSPGDQIAKTLDELHQVFMDLLSLANLAWRGDDEESVKSRLLLIGPYLGKVLDISKAASGRRLGGKKSGNEDEVSDAPIGESAETGAPDPSLTEPVPEPTPASAEPPDDEE
jgi:hypothetical protein